MTPSARELELALLMDGSVRSRVASGTASPAMRSFGRLLERAAHNAVPVLLVGESGTGKTTFGRALHAASGATGPLVAVDCPTTTTDLSAEAVAARDGTLFLDEVAELSPAAQTAALRLLQEAHRLSFRIVASTRHDLDAEAAAGRFRKDLFYRLDILRLRIPPLRERVEDILPIAREHLALLAETDGRPRPELSPELERALLRYSWPGNVQELLGVLQRMLILCPGGCLEIAALPDRIAAASPHAS